MTYVLSSIEWKIILDGSAQRKEYPEIPQKASREIVVNAFGHAKYDSNTAFEINVFKECKLAKVKYEYENTKSGFKFTFYRPLGQKYVQDQMTKTETKVLSAIKKNNYARISEIAKAIEKSDKTVSRAIKKLKELKYIERVGDDYNGYWKVLER